VLQFDILFWLIAARTTPLKPPLMLTQQKGTENTVTRHMAPPFTSWLPAVQTLMYKTLLNQTYKLKWPPSPKQQWHAHDYQVTGTTQWIALQNDNLWQQIALYTWQLVWHQQPCTVMTMTIICQMTHSPMMPTNPPITLRMPKVPKQDAVHIPWWQWNSLQCETL